MKSSKLAWEDASDQLDPSNLPPLPVIKSKAPISKPLGRPPGMSVKSLRELKILVAIEAIKENLSQRELASKYGVPQPLISILKKQAIQSIREYFEKQSGWGATQNNASSGALNREQSDAELIALQDLIGPLRDAADLIEQTRAAISAHCKASAED